MKTYIKLLILLACAVHLSAQSFAVEGATLHLGNGQTIEKGILVVENGRIADLIDLGKPQTTRAEYTTVVEGDGLHLYPGFLLMNNIAGLTETDAVRATLDYDETGPFTPEVRAGIAFNAASRILPTLVQNGVLFVESTPKGGMVSGQSSVLRLNGKPWTQAAVSPEAALHLFWPDFSPEHIEGDPKANKVWSKRSQIRKERLRQLEETLADAQAGRLGQAYEVWRKVISGEQLLMLHASGAREALEAMAWLDTRPNIRWALVDCFDPMPLLPELKARNIPVLLSRIWELPYASDADPMHRWKDALHLIQEGILVMLDYEGDMEAMGGRNLGFMAGSLMRYGLTEAQILPLLTSNPAKVLGLNAQIGSLEVGKEASFFLCQGSPFEPKSFDMKGVWIQGKSINLTGPQERLKESYD